MRAWAAHASAHASAGANASASAGATAAWQLFGTGVGMADDEAKSVRYYIIYMDLGPGPYMGIHGLRTNITMSWVAICAFKYIMNTQYIPYITSLLSSYGGRYTINRVAIRVSEPILFVITWVWCILQVWG